ncbi:biofilm/acid-resistance regulator YmgB/AriR [Erwiniaceae bacterium L1_54_6]|jgi:probable RcsB/C two-component-system connector, global regulator of biofilm formation and acid-resistance|uniref:Biofilm development protein AriR n=1 Tax=Pantoea cypripedii TaxID=55209 RepID=A0A6B9G0Z3_PANCY|nr:biofilm/acid-resistance regulator YmgB/AriR [Pantoea cypripedii]MDF7657664.1 biofilm/acid-resistance regulator YmgB/AriR [Erwiniaceae bacterium L1_54_6]QGY28713.1 biofilm development protein AriR [Pantoea cypripedii]
MQNAVISRDQAIARYFNLASESADKQMAVFGQIVAEILQTGMPVTNKAIISALIVRLEQENDVAQLDIYRQLLEIVVHKTPDDVLV